MKNVLLGVSKGDNTINFAEVDESNEVNRISSYYLIDKNQSYDKNYYLDPNGSTQLVTIKGITIEVGEKLPKVLPKVSKALQKSVDGAYEANGMFCDSCGTFHDTEQYHDLSYIITDNGSLYCKECVEFEDVALSLNKGSDIFKAKDMTGIEVSKEFIEVETLFCDSSGLGNESEAAMTKNTTIKRVETILDQNECELYAGLTGIGQFQVYVTIWKRKTKKTPKKKVA